MSKVCMVIPTYNEAENLPKLVGALEREMQKGDFKVIVVDDNSPDRTAEVAKKLNRRYGNIIIHRRPEKLGIGSAIHDGLQIALSFADSEYIVTMDADLSHNPKDVPHLLSETENADLIQGSRYVKGGRIIGWGFFRRAVSYTANFLCRLLFRTGLHEHTTYFRIYSRKCAETAVRNVHCDRYEWAIASILTTKDHGFRIKEVPITFVNRARGKSKLKASDILRWFFFIEKTFILRFLNKFGLVRFMKFCVVGTMGILVNEGLLWILTELSGLFYLISAVIGIETSILSNFTLNDLWTFRDLRHSSMSTTMMRALKCNLVYVVGLTINIIILWTLTEFFDIRYLISNLFGIIAAVFWNYGGCLKWIWKRRIQNKLFKGV